MTTKVMHARHPHLDPAPWKERLAGMLALFREYLIYSDTTLLEITTAMAAFCWGGWVANPWLDQAARTSPDVARFISLDLFGLLSIVLGCLQIVGLMLGKPWVRQGGAMCGFVFWLFFFFASAAASPRPPVTAFYFVFCLASGFTYLRVCRYYTIRAV